jgi:hypothetical protein
METLMASASNINGKITVELSATDRALLKRIADAVDRAYPKPEQSFASGGLIPSDTMRLMEPDSGYVLSKAEVQEHGERFLKHLAEQNLPAAEGDHLLDPDADHTGDDVE